MFQSLTRRVLEPPAFGLDISDLTVKFCRLIEGKGSLLLDAFGEIDIPEGIVVSGEIKKPSDLARILGENLRTFEGKKIRDRYCIVSLPEEKSFVRVISFPNIKTVDIAKAIRWEVEAVVPLPVDQIIFDYEPVLWSAVKKDGVAVGNASDEIQPSGISGTRDVLLTAFPKDVIASYHEVLRSAGFYPLALELESQAISRALVNDAAGQSPTIIVDIGTTRTSFIIFAGGSLVFTKSVIVGGHDFEVSISEKLGVTLEEARQVKIEAGLNKNYHDGKVFEALAPHLNVITNELDQQITFYQNHPAKHHETFGGIDHVVLCGGDANLIGLEKYIAITIKKKTALGDPFINFHFPEGTIPAIPKAKSLKYTTAIGLALRAIGR